MKNTKLSEQWERKTGKWTIVEFETKLGTKKCSIEPAEGEWIIYFWGLGASHESFENCPDNELDSFLDLVYRFLQTEHPFSPQNSLSAAIKHYCSRNLPNPGQELIAVESIEAYKKAVRYFPEEEP